MWIFWLVTTVLLSTFVIFTAFPLITMVEGAKKAGIETPRGIRITGKIWYVIGGPSDIIFNTIPAWLIFREVSFVGVTFSQRIQTYVDMMYVGGDIDEDVLKWANFLNYCDPGHITKVPSK